MRKSTITKVKKYGRVIESVKDKLSAIEEPLSELETSASEKLDNLSDRARDGEKGEELASEVDTLQQLVSALDSALEACEEFLGEIPIDDGDSEG